MNQLLNTIESIFYNILKLENFEIVEEKESSVLFYNGKCYLFIGHHLGEVYVNLSKDKKRILQPLMWAIINSKISFEDFLKLEYSPETKMKELLIYSLCFERTIISLYCKDLIQGDFSKEDYYFDNFDKKSEELYFFMREN